MKSPTLWFLKVKRSEPKETLPTSGLQTWRCWLLFINIGFANQKLQSKNALKCNFNRTLENLEYPSKKLSNQILNILQSPENTLPINTLYIDVDFYSTFRSIGQTVKLVVNSRIKSSRVKTTILLRFITESQELISDKFSLMSDGVFL